MIFFRVDIADIRGLFIILGANTIRLFTLAVKRDLTAVVHGDDRPLLIGAKNLCTKIAEAAQRLFVGVTVHIVFAAGNDDILRVGFSQEIVAVGRAASVMTRLQQICLQILTHFDHFFLRCAPGVAGEQHAVFPVLHLQANGVIVCVVIGLIRPQKLDLALAKRSCIPRLRSLGLKALTIDRLFQTARDPAVITIQHVNRICAKLLQHVPSRSNVILMRMSKNHIFQMIDPQAFDVAQQEVRIIPVSCIYQHRFTLRDQQRRICLAHIQKICRQILIRFQGRLTALSIRRASI